MGAGALEEAPLGTYHERKFVVPVRLDLANLSNEVNYSIQLRLRGNLRQRDSQGGLHGRCEYDHASLSISSVKEKCCSSLLIAFGLSARNAPLDVHGWYTESHSFGRRVDRQP